MPNELKTEGRESKFLTLWSNSGFDPLAKNGCAIEAGYSPGSASASSNRVFKKLVSNEKMRRALKKKGITFDRLADKLVELMEAKHPFAPLQPDNLAQHKAVDTALKLHDAFPATKIDIDKHERKEIIISGEVVQRLERYNLQREILEKGETFDVLPAAD